MYRAKESGKDRYVVFGEEMRARALTRLADEVELRHALAPRRAARALRAAVRARQRPRARARGARALAAPDPRPARARATSWRIAEETGMVVPIGAWAIGEACRQLAGWREAGARRDVAVSINVSACSSATPASPPTVEQALRASDLAPPALCLEIPEVGGRGRSAGRDRRRSTGCAPSACGSRSTASAPAISR